MFSSKRAHVHLLAMALLALALGTGCSKKHSSNGAPPAPPSPYLAFVVQPTSANTNATLAPSITVELRDGSGNVVATATDTVTLALQVNPGAATLSGTVARAAVAGVATFDDLSLDIPYTGYVLSASATGYANGVSLPFNIFSPGATQLVFTIQPPTTVAPYEAFDVEVEARNAGGILDPSYNGPVTIAFGTQPPGPLLLH